MSTWPPRQQTDEQEIYGPCMARNTFWIFARSSSMRSFTTRHPSVRPRCTPAVCLGIGQITPRGDFAYHCIRSGRQERWVIDQSRSRACCRDAVLSASRRKESLFAASGFANDQSHRIRSRKRPLTATRPDPTSRQSPLVARQASCQRTRASTSCSARGAWAAQTI